MPTKTGISTNNQAKRYISAQCGGTNNISCIQYNLVGTTSSQPIDMSYTTMPASAITSAIYTSNNEYWHPPDNLY